MNLISEAMYISKPLGKFQIPTLNTAIGSLLGAVALFSAVDVRDPEFRKWFCGMIPYTHPFFS
jgi:hypothetical protein